MSPIPALPGSRLKFAQKRLLTSRGLSRACPCASAPVTIRRFSTSAYPGSTASTASRSATTSAESLISIARVLTRAPPRSAAALHVPYQIVVDILLRIEYEPLLRGLQLMHEEHQHDRDQQRDQRRIERRAEILGDAGDIALHGAVSLAEREAYAAHRADEPDRRNRPCDVAGHRQIRLETLAFGIEHRVRHRGDVLHVARRPEPLERGEQHARHEHALIRLGQRLQRARIL